MRSPWHSAVPSRLSPNGKFTSNGYLAELRQGDVESVEDWSIWYAEYLLGLR